MNTTEKIVLEQIVKNLEKSMLITWKTGYLDDWTEHARKMKTVIGSSTQIMKAMLQDDDGKKIEDMKEENIEEK